MDTTSPRRGVRQTIWATILTLAALHGLATGQDTRPAPITLEGQQVAIALDPGSGAITRISDIASGINLIPLPGMAENFRLVLLAPEQKQLLILGRVQKLSGFARDAGKLTLHWDGPLTDESGTAQAIAVSMDIAAKGSALEFTLHLKNDTAYKIHEACYPLIGGMAGFHAPGQPSDARLWIPTSRQTEQPFALPIHVTFGYPGQMCMAFTCIQSQSTGRSIYFASHDPVARQKDFHFTGLPSPNGPELYACLKHHPFTPPGKTFDGSPVVFAFINGDWHAAGQLYRDWFKSAFGITQPAQCWIRRESFFLMTMFMLPEGTITFKFKDIPAWAKAAKDHGINSVQISGWQVGGHDNGYPNYTPDPRLGTWEELEAGIREAHKLGVKVYFFVNYQPVMLDSDWYKNELHKYREMGPNGEMTWNAGWGMGTLWARMDHPKKMTWADPSFPQFRQIIVKQFAKLAQIGADGVHVDKMFPVSIEYNPDVPLSPDTASWEGAILLTREVMTECRKYSPDWAMSFECNWDRMLEFSGATWWVGNQLITREVFPENAETLGLYQAYDYLGVNNAVRGGHIVMVAPLNFCRNVDWPPFADLADYIKEVKRIRDSLADTVFYGQVLGKTGVQLEAAPERDVEYNVFRHRETGNHVCILTNRHRASGQVTISTFEGKAGGSARLHVPFKPTVDVKLPATVEVPGERIVFVEQIDDNTPPAGPPTEPRQPAQVTAYTRRESIKLEDANCLLEFATDNGSLTRLFDKKAGVELIKEPRLAASFKFALPIPGKEPWQTIEANWIFGREQTLTTHEIQGNRLTLTWHGPLKNYLDEPYDVSVTETIELTHGGVQFILSIGNPTNYAVGETYFPVIGGIHGLGAGREEELATQMIRPGAKDAFAIADIFRLFTNMSWLGDQCPEQFYACPKDQPEPWLGFHDPASGHSVCMGTLLASKQKPVIHLELFPANSGTERDDGNWPRPEELHGQPVGVEVSFVDVIGLPAHQNYRATPVFIQFTNGGGPKLRELFSAWQSQGQKSQK